MVLSGKVRQVRLGGVGRGKVGLGTVRYGRQGLARCVRVRYGVVR